MIQKEITKEMIERAKEITDEIFKLEEELKDIYGIRFQFNAI